MNLQQPQLLRALGRPEAIALVVGSVIGSGIFFKPQRIAAELGSFEAIIAVWLVAGLLCLLGALSLAELAAMLPRAGGLYVYLREAYGKGCAFLYGWSLFFVVRPAATGALGAAFARSLPLEAGVQLMVSVGVIVLLAWINIMGVIWGGRIQTATTVLKAGFLLGIAVLPWVLGQVEAQNFTTHLTDGGAELTVTSFMLALLAVMFAYNSWHEVTPLAEEIREPRRNIPWALIVGVAVLVALYVGVNLAYHGVLTMDEVAQTKNTASALMERMFGTVGGSVMTALVMCSVFGTINANLLHAPRVYFAMGRDGVFFKQLGRVHPSRRTPVVAIACQAGLASLLLAVATLVPERDVFDFLTNIVVFGGSIFYVLAVLAVVVLRRRRPELERPYRTLGYPLTPLLFVAAYAWFLPTIFAERPLDSWIGLGVIAAGVPAFFVWNRPTGSLTGTE